MAFRITLIFLPLVWLTSCADEQPLALGTLERDRIVHNATAAEIITALPIVEGSSVKEGDLLVQLDSRQQKANLFLAQAHLKKARARWDELSNGARKEDIEAARADLSGAQASLSAASKTFVRIRRLRQEGLIPQSDFDQALALRDNAQAQVRASEERLLALTNGVREEVLRQAEADIHVAEAQVEVARIVLDELQVKSTRNGVLDSLPWNLGERVSVGAPVAIVLADSAPYARVYVPETNRVSFKVGSEYEVHMDGELSPLVGKVRWVANEAAFTPYFALNESDRARLMFLAELDIVEGDTLPMGMPVQIFPKKGQ